MRKAYAAIGAGAIFITASELLLKTGAMHGALRSLWTWAGIGTYLLSFACWLYVLRRMPLSIAYGLISIVQVLVPLGAWFFLGETISPHRWLGIGLVLIGTLLVPHGEA
jgi:multidrug transporter EmrE-like cation transporter